MNPSIALLDEADAFVAQRQFPRSHQLCLEALTLDPNCARAWHLLGEIAVEQNAHGQALEHFTKAAELEPDHAGHHARRALTLAQMQRQSAARQAVARAAAAPIVDAKALDAAGIALTLLGDVEGARDLFERAVRIPGAYPNIIRNLGVSYQSLGDFKAAEACYRKVLALNPASHRTWASLVRLRRQTAEDNVIPELERRAEEASTPEASLYLGHALAKSLEDIGDYSGALRWLERGKAGSRGAYPYDDRAFGQLFAAAGDLAAAPRVAVGQALQAAPIFVVGMPRSGTTLVERILASHSQVASFGETPAFGLAVRHVTGTSVTRFVDLETFQALPAADMNAIGQTYLAQLPAAGRRTVDKLPFNFLYAGAIRKALPNARIVCLRRDPLDTCLANYTQLFGQDAQHHAYNLDMATTAQCYAHFDALAGRMRAVLPADRYMELSYEKLVASPEAQTRRLLAFCSLAWEPACLEFHKASGAVTSASSVQVRQPLYATSVGRAQRFGEGLAPMIEVLQAKGILPRPAEAQRQSLTG